MIYIKYIFVSFYRDIKNLFYRRLNVKFRLLYPFAKYISVIRFLLFGKKYINYYGSRFVYDNWITPLSLQAYTHEITYKILANADSDIKKILDIGGNIGQFAITAKKVVKDVEIFIFEPNPYAYDLLCKNTENIDDIKVFNFGIGESGKGKLYFLKNRTGTGSMIKSNALVSKISVSKNLSSVEVELRNDVSVLCGDNHFDLVKIDVEGFENSVVKNLKGIVTRYMFIEVTLNGKDELSDGELFSNIYQNFGHFDIVYCGGSCKSSVNVEMLLKFKGG